MAVAIFGYAFFHPPLWLAALLFVPMLIDGFTQYFTAYESINRRRLWTGALFGYGFLTIIIMSYVWVFHWGQHLGSQLSA